MTEQKPNTIERAYLFGELGKAWYKQGDKLFILSVNKKAPEECEVSDVESLYDDSLEDPMREESKPQEGKLLNVETVLKKLQFLYRAHTALLFALHGLDGKLKDSRLGVIERANELCQEEQVLEFVRGRLLNRPLPGVADIRGAIQYAEEKDIIESIYRETEKKWGREKKKKVFMNFLREDLSLTKEPLIRYLEANHIGYLPPLEFGESVHVGYLPPPEFGESVHVGYLLPPKSGKSVSTMRRTNFENKVNQCDAIIMTAVTRTLCFEIIVKWLTTQLKLYRKATKFQKPLLICSEDLKIKLFLNMKDMLSQFNILAVREVELFSEQITSLPIIEYLYD